MSCDCDHCLALPEGGHPDYLDVIGALLRLHAEKAGGYGTDEDLFANFTAVARAKGRPRYEYAVDRALEKTQRVYSLIAQGRTDELAEEFLDIASLFACAEAMRREDIRSQA